MSNRQGSRRRKRERKKRIREATNLVLAGATVVIAVLMVTAVILFIRNGSLFGGLFAESESQSSETIPETEELNLQIAVPPDPGLNTLETGEIVYVITEDELRDYDEANLIAVETSWQTASGGEASDNVDLYYLASSWLDVDGDLYYFDEEGHACTDTYSERAFDYDFDDDGTLSSISYNANYRESSVDGGLGYAGLVQTRSLSVYMDMDKTLGDYVALRYKRSTESLTYYLGGETNTQYASPYAFDICDGRIYYLALEDRQYIASSSIYENMAGKVFCMTPGTDQRYISAEGALGFKVLIDDAQNTVVYYYDGDRIIRSSALTVDDNMVNFSEDADYTVDIETAGKAYLELVTGQRVTVESDAFKAGNFTYSLAADGEILSVAEKTTVNTGGYTYKFQNGTNFGEDMARLIRGDSEDNWELISGEIPGKVGNIHFDYGTSCIIAEYEDNNGGGGLIKATLDGDIDLLTEARITAGDAELYGISDDYVIYKVTDGEDVEFRTASIGASSPIAAAVEPVTISLDEGDDSVVGDAPGEPAGENYDDTVQGQSPPETIDTGSGSQGSGSGDAVSGSGEVNVGDSDGGVVVPEGPGA